MFTIIADEGGSENIICKQATLRDLVLKISIVSGWIFQYLPSHFGVLFGVLLICIFLRSLFTQSGSFDQYRFTICFTCVKFHNHARQIYQILTIIYLALRKLRICKINPSANSRYMICQKICSCLFSICRRLSDGGGVVWNYRRQSALCEANSLSWAHSSQLLNLSWQKIWNSDIKGARCSH